MGNHTPPLALYPTRIDIPPEIRICLTTVLSHTLTCTLDLRSAERFALYATVLRASSTHAADVEDGVTAAIYTEVSRGIEKRLWMLDAYLHT